MKTSATPRQRGAFATTDAPTHHCHPGHIVLIGAHSGGCTSCVFWQTCKRHAFTITVSHRTISPPRKPSGLCLSITPFSLSPGNHWSFCRRHSFALSCFVLVFVFFSLCRVDFRSITITLKLVVSVLNPARRSVLLVQHTCLSVSCFSWHTDMNFLSFLKSQEICSHRVNIPTCRQEAGPEWLLSL